MRAAESTSRVPDASAGAKTAPSTAVSEPTNAPALAAAAAPVAAPARCVGLRNDEVFANASHGDVDGGALGQDDGVLSLYATLC
jgi:hypothetical protein